MKRESLLLGALLVAASSACAPLDSSNDPPEPQAGASAAAMTPGTCGGRRWIGVALPCPTVAGWNEAQLFPGASAPLDGYCAFDFAGPGAPTANDIVTLQSSGATLLAEDCPVAVPQGPPADVTKYEEELSRSLRQGFRERVGSVATLKAQRPRGIAPARVVLVDTAPDALLGGAIHAGKDRHGDTLAGIVGDIGCDEGECHVEVASALGMPWLDRDTYSLAGGHVGRLSDVARAIRRAVDDAPAERLVLNLSLGWEDAPGLSECGDDPSVLNAPARAVYDVIEQARCKGALVIAAAGNDAGGATPPSGLVCPARWEALPISACGDLAGEPLLHAAGGVDHAGQPIAVTRPNGRPRIQALAFGGVAWKSGDPIPPPLTGTSVAAAVTSAIAAVVWTHNPTLSAAKVMDTLYASADDAGVADTCPAGTSGPCQARIVTLCPALAAAGVVTSACAPSPLSLHRSPILAPSVDAALSLILAATPVTPVEAHPIEDATTVVPRFLAPSPALGGGAFPEPVVPLCPSCSYSIPSSGSDIFYALTTTSLDRPTLVLESTSSRSATSLSIASPLAANTSYRFHVTGAPAGVTRAWITGYTDSTDATSLTQEIVVR